MRAWKCKQVIDFDKSTTTVKEEKKKRSLDESDKLLWSISLHKHQIPYYHPLNQWLLGATNGNQGQHKVPTRFAWGLHKVGMRLTWGWHEVYMRLAWVWHEVAWGWHEVAWGWHEVAWGWHEVYMRLAWGWLKVCMRVVWGWHEVAWGWHEVVWGWHEVACVRSCLCMSHYRLLQTSRERQDPTHWRPVKSAFEDQGKSDQLEPFIRGR